MIEALRGLAKKTIRLILKFSKAPELKSTAMLHTCASYKIGHDITHEEILKSQKKCKRCIKEKAEKDHG